MKAAGIIAEYNPLHSGHVYHINETRRKTGADYIVVAMSGSFTQRGIPAFFDKYLRTRTALLAGADLVLELPVAVSTGSGEFFAKGAVTLLNSLGVITHLSFGSECGEIARLKEITGFLADENEEFKAILQNGLSQGKTYPSAVKSACTALMPELAGLLDFPNNTLGIEYIKALSQLNSPIEPVTVKREGMGYGELHMPENGLASSRGLNRTDGNNLRTAQASSEAYENNLHTAQAFSEAYGNNLHTEKASGEAYGESLHPSSAFLRRLCEENACEEFCSCLPQFCSEIFPTVKDGSQASRHCFLSEDDFSTVLINKLLYSPVSLTAYSDMSEEIANRLNGLSDIAVRSFSELTERLKTKQLTAARIRRALLHTLLDVTNEDMLAVKGASAAPYIRVLGIKKTASALMKAVNENAASPVVQRVPHDLKTLSDEARAMLSKDLKAYELYRLIYRRKYPESAYVPKPDYMGIVTV